MSSLPQGWHGIPVPMKNSVQSSTSVSASVPTTIRKKWNSPFSSDIPRSKLPSYNPSTVRLQKSSINNTLHRKPMSRPSNSQTETSTSTLKSPVGKELKLEIMKLKKELTTLKTENSILTVKVRRVDDENMQKSKQIEKLRVELKSAQKNETSSSKKSKDSEVLLLRQKCLRLEGALKEKDAIIKKLSNEGARKLEGTECCNQFSTKEPCDINESKLESLTESKSIGKSASTIRTNFSRANLSSKGEVTKLRDMIHKLEKENQDLQQLVKDKGEEVKRLKLHLRSRTYKKTPEFSTANGTVKAITNLSNTTTNLPKKRENKIPKETAVTKKSGLSATTPKIPTSEGKISKDKDKQNKSNAIRTRKSTYTLKKEQQNLSNNQPNGRSQKSYKIKPSSSLISPYASTKPQFFVSERNIEEEVEEMRKNIAAKRIQRSWRNHRQQVNVAYI